MKQKKLKKTILSLGIALFTIFSISNPILAISDPNKKTKEVYESLDRLLYKSKVTVQTTGEYASEGNVNRNGNWVGNTFACASGEVYFKVIVPVEYDVEFSATVSELSGGASAQDFYNVQLSNESSNGNAVYDITVYHRSIGYHRHGSIGNELLDIVINASITKKVDLTTYSAEVNYEIDTWKEDGSQIQTPQAPIIHQINNLKTNESYTIDSPFINGYTPSKASVTGIITNSNVSEKVIYYRDRNNNGIADKYETNYSATVSYEIDPELNEIIYGDKLPSAPKAQVITGLLTKEEYSFASPILDRLVAEKAVVEGTIENSSVNETVTYYLDRNNNGVADKDESKYSATVSYVIDPELNETIYGNTLPSAPEAKSVLDLLTKEKYSITSPTLEGFVADKEVVEGTIENSSVNETVTYYLDRNKNGIADKDETLLKIEFVDYNDDVLSTQLVLPGLSASLPIDPIRTGYEFTGWSGIYQNVSKDERVVATYRSLILPIVPTPTPTPTPTPGQPTIPAPVLPAPFVPVVNTPTQVVPVPVQNNNPQNAPQPEEEVVVEEDVTPKAEPEKVKDNSTPKAKAEGSWALFNLIATGLSCILAIFLLLSKQKKDEKNNGFKKLASIIVPIVSIVTFVLVENMTMQMVMSDKWSLLFAAFLIVQIAICAVGIKYRSTKNKEA